MKPDPKIFDDLSRVAGGALNVFSGLREQILNDVKARADEAAARMNLVPREDFDRLQARVNALQSRLDALDAAAAKTGSANEKSIKKTTPARKKKA